MLTLNDALAHPMTLDRKMSPVGDGEYEADILHLGQTITIWRHDGDNESTYGWVGAGKQNGEVLDYLEECLEDCRQALGVGSHSTCPACGVGIGDSHANECDIEQAGRRRLLHHVSTHLSDSEIVTATDAFSDLLADAPGEIVEELLLPIFNWSDWWPKRLAAEMLGLSTDDEYEWEELVDAFEAREGQDLPKQSEHKEGL